MAQPSSSRHQAEPKVFDPSLYKPSEARASLRYTEYEVSEAYSNAIDELNTLLEMTTRFTKPASCATPERFAYYVQKDVARMAQRIQISRNMLKALDKRFHYEAKRLRTRDRASRLRWWRQELLQDVEVKALKRGDEGRQAARRAMEEKARNTVTRFGLKGLWIEALMKERQAAERRGEDGESSGCETSESEER